MGRLLSDKHITYLNRLAHWFLGCIVILIAVYFVREQLVGHVLVIKALASHTQDEIEDGLIPPKYFSAPRSDSLAKLLDHRDITVRRAASTALTWKALEGKERSAIPALQKHANDADFEIKADCLTSLAFLGNRKALITLTELAKQEKRMSKRYLHYIFSLRIGLFRESGDNIVRRLRTIPENSQEEHLSFCILHRLLLQKGFLREDQYINEEGFVNDGCVTEEDNWFLCDKTDRKRYLNELLAMWNDQRMKYRSVYDFRDGDIIKKYPDNFSENMIGVHIVLIAYACLCLTWTFILLLVFIVRANFRKKQGQAPLT